MKKIQKNGSFWVAVLLLFLANSSFAQTIPSDKLLDKIEQKKSKN